MKVFLESTVLILNKINAKMLEGFEQFFITKQGFFSPKEQKKKKKKTDLSTMTIGHTFNKS